jgi:signal transduction histidine kinase
MNIIVNQSEIMERLVDDLLTAARLDSGRLDLVPRRFDLVQLARQTIDLVGVASLEHQIRVDAPGGSVEGCWDRDRIARVIQNLLSNAVRYSPDGGEIIVTVTDDGSGARFSVRDHGIGVAPDIANQIFDRFYRVKTRRSDPNGMGLGLYISRVLVEAHGGRIWTEPASGGGSIFAFTLPHTDR